MSGIDTPDPSEPDPFAVLRRRMGDTQLRSRGIRDPRVLTAMNTVRREEFVPSALRGEAYSDWPLPIGNGQTISQPFTVAFMAAALRLTGQEKALEVGTGSGYGAAVLSHLVREVHTIERIPALADRARQLLVRLGYDNVHVHQSDGTLGLPGEAPFDAICITASAESLPPAFAEQLALGGRAIIPIGDLYEGQQLLRFTQTATGLQREDLGRFAFVPLIGKHGWHLSQSESS